MNLFRAFMELDEAYNNRYDMIDDIKRAGKSYKFDRYTDAQIFRIWQRLQKTSQVKKSVEVSREPKHDLDLDFEAKYEKYCDCGAKLTDAGFCPVCHDGEEDLSEELLEFVTASGKQVTIPKPATQVKPSISPYNSAKTTTGKYKVGIVLDKGRLRAMGDDGEHGLAFVAFPNNLRQFEGQHYEVDQLIWNGKNYRVSGKIEEV